MGTFMKQTTSTEVESRLLAFMHNVYATIKENKCDICAVNLTRAAEQAGCKSVPTQDVLINGFKWDKEPTINDAKKVHQLQLMERMKQKKTSIDKVNVVVSKDENKKEEPYKEVEVVVNPNDDEIDKLKLQIRVLEANAKANDEKRKLAEKRQKTLEGEIQRLTNEMQNDKKKLQNLSDELKRVKDSVQQKALELAAEIIDDHECYEQMMQEQVAEFANKMMELKQNWESRTYATEEENQSTNG